MTHSEANRLLSAPLFDKNELALIKLLVLESLSKYDNISEANCTDKRFIGNGMSK